MSEASLDKIVLTGLFATIFLSALYVVGLDAEKRAADEVVTITGRTAPRAVYHVEPAQPVDTIRMDWIANYYYGYSGQDSVFKPVSSPDSVHSPQTIRWNP